MKAIALIKAREHLDQAKEAAGRLTLDNGFRSYEEAWSQFLSQVSRFYSKMEQGSKGCAKSEPWFGKKKHERRKDQLLSYLHHARDSDEHGIDYITVLKADSSVIEFPEAQEVTVSMWIKRNEDGTLDVRNPTVRTPAGQFDDVVHVNPRVELVTVHDHRYGDSFDPPLMHFNRPIVDRTPQHLADLAIHYLEGMFEEASALPQQF
jgi:hypothetical protein